MPTPSHRLALELLEPRSLLSLTLPAGFTAADYATGLNTPTALAFTSDSRLLVTEKGGTLRIAQAPSQNGTATLNPTPALTLDVDTNGERGLLGVAIDPAFATDSFVYLYYTAKTPDLHNRVSRFTLTGDTIDPASERVLLDLPTLDKDHHNGGAIHFGTDGKLYVAVGENGHPDRAPLLDNPFGKILRINADGSIPSDNPFLSQTTGINQAIFAKGLRNPYTFSVQPVTGKLYIDDVGQNTYEEINVGTPGADFGWPSTEGPTNKPGITPPVYSYRHPEGSAIIGGAFLPDGRYYFGDLTGGFIRALDPASKRVTSFARGVGTLTGMAVGPDQSLYLLDYGSGTVTRIAGRFAGQPGLNAAPKAVLSGPGASTRYRYVAGSTLRFALAGSDKEDRRVAASGLHLTITRVTGGVEESTPLLDVQNRTKATFTLPNDTAALGNDVVYRVRLTATDSGGLTDTITRDLAPAVRNIRVALSLPRGVTTPTGVTGQLNGNALSLPGTFQTVAGVRQLLVAPATLTLDGKTYTLVSYTGSRRGAAGSLDFPAPNGNATIVAVYR